jgi:hypothetical protein
LDKNSRCDDFIVSMAGLRLGQSDSSVSIRI